MKRKIIHLRADQAKTASRRIIPVSNNLHAWLFPRVGKSRVIPNAEEDCEADAFHVAKRALLFVACFLGKSAEPVFMGL